MTDFEVCPIGTAARIAELEAAIDSIETSHGLTSDGSLWRFWSRKSVEVSENNRELRAALTQSRAETAAAYERAAQVLDIEAADLKSDAERFRSGTDPHHYRMNFASAAIRQAKAIRALNPADQTAARGQMIAEAEARGMREAAAIVARHGETGRKALGVAKDLDTANIWSGIVTRCDMIGDAILAAIPKGGDA